MLDQYTNAELEEMGYPEPCGCREMLPEIADNGDVYQVCEDCGEAVLVKEAPRW